MRPENPKHTFLFMTLACLLLALLVTALPALAEEENAPGSPAGTKEVSSTVKKAEGKLGKATYYADRYHGRRTSSGAIFDQRKMTAAHPTISHGTKVRVKNLANNRSVVVTVIDRCRKRKVESIDRSRAAARDLGIIRRGVATVRITPLGDREL